MLEAFYSDETGSTDEIRREVISIDRRNKRAGLSLSTFDFRCIPTLRVYNSFIKTSVELFSKLFVSNN